MPLPTKAYVAALPQTLSKAVHRLAGALARHVPEGVTITDDLAAADLVLCHVIGPEGWVGDPVQEEPWKEGYLARFKARGQRYAIFQHCLRTTNWPHPEQWADVWRGATAVVSHYPLADIWDEDVALMAGPRPNFLRVHLGVDGEVFTPPQNMVSDFRDLLVMTSGYVAGTECVGEWATVCNELKEGQFHLGPDLPQLAHRRHVRNAISDDTLASWYRVCRYVSGLRRSEGFELPAFEGLCCGVRPVMFDREDARHWLGDHAEYISEGSPEVVVQQLLHLARKPYRPVTSSEVEWARETFRWETMADAIWRSVLNG